MIRRHRASQPAGPDPMALALEAQRRALQNCCAGCCSQDSPCRYHKGFMAGVGAAMLAYLDTAGVGN